VFIVFAALKKDRAPRFFAFGKVFHPRKTTLNFGASGKEKVMGYQV